mmetsp:Transcript_30330/g.40001  ORF Transcript_30330/g.40001 Transcript_30330/m.40001 type:complete len:243 (+) Transcript_30330:2503-3231(+)
MPNGEGDESKQPQVRPIKGQEPQYIPQQRGERASDSHQLVQRHVHLHISRTSSKVAAPKVVVVPHSSRGVHVCIGRGVGGGGGVGVHIHCRQVAWDHFRRGLYWLPRRGVKIARHHEPSSPCLPFLAAAHTFFLGSLPPGCSGQTCHLLLFLLLFFKNLSIISLNIVSRIHSTITICIHKLIDGCIIQFNFFFFFSLMTLVKFLSPIDIIIMCLIQWHLRCNLLFKLVCKTPFSFPEIPVKA